MGKARGMATERGTPFHEAGEGCLPMTGSLQRHGTIPGASIVSTSSTRSCVKGSPSRSEGVRDQGGRAGKLDVRTGHNQGGNRSCIAEWPY